MKSAIARDLIEAMDLSATTASLVELSGGGFGVTCRLLVDDQAFFLKRLPVENSDSLDAEADGLHLLALADDEAALASLQVPEVHGVFEIMADRYLVLEWLELIPLSTASRRRLGDQLASHHRQATANHYGLERDNWIGGTPQINTTSRDWTDFFFENRLRYLINRLTDSGVRFEAGTVDGLRKGWVRRFPDYQPTPSLLHGDLWAGNAAMLGDGSPVVYDPAVHYGDRECDLAMAALFGGFGPEFFNAYNASWPLEPGWESRREFYQLYHVLNHALLFGAGYLDDARRRIERLIRR